MNGYGYGPGAGLTRNNRFARMLMDQQAAAPPVTQDIQGVAQVLRGLGTGFLMRKDERDRAAAMEAMTSGMSAQPWINPDTGMSSAPLGVRRPAQDLGPQEMPDGSMVTPSQAIGPEQQFAPAGGIPGAIAATQGLGDNPYAQRNLQGLLMQQGAAEAATAERELGWAREDVIRQGKLVYDEEQAELQYARDLEIALAGGGGSAPSKIQVFEYYQSLDTPEKKAEFLTLLRANPPVNLGASYATINPAFPDLLLGDIGKTVPPQDTAVHRAEVAEEVAIASAVGAEQGDVEARLAAAEASMPRLEAAVSQLKELGEVATYTLMGRGIDIAMKEAGMDPDEGAIARSTYIAHVKNNVLPLLRQTFGAAFTAAEGDSLLATLGDPSMHPKEKEAVLNAFISDKAADLEALRRQAGSGRQDLLPAYDEADIAFTMKKHGMTREEVLQAIGAQ